MHDEISLVDRLRKDMDILKEAHVALLESQSILMKGMTSWTESHTATLSAAVDGMKYLSERVDKLQSVLLLLLERDGSDK